MFRSVIHRRFHRLVADNFFNTFFHTFFHTFFLTRTARTVARTVALALALPLCGGLLTLGLPAAVRADVSTEAPLLVTATRFPASIDTAPVNLIIITADDIRRSSATHLSDVLRYQAGVDVSDLFGISGARASVDLGGFGQNGGQNTLLLLNGRRLNDVDLQGANLAGIALGSFERIEIVQGSSTVLYGDNAVGGVINIVTRNGFDRQPDTLSLQTGSFATRRLAGDFSGQRGASAWSISLDGLKSDGYREQSAFEHFNLAGELSREADAGGLYGLRFNRSQENLELPGALAEATYRDDPDASTTTIEDASERRSGIEAFLQGERVAAELSLQNKRQEATVFGDTGADLQTLAFTPRVKLQSGIHGIIAGLDYYRSRLDAESAFTNFAPPPDLNINRSETTRDSLAWYVTDTLAIADATTLSLGWRHQQVAIEVRNRSNTAAPSSADQSDTVTAADIALSHEFASGHQAYVRLAQSFRAPVLDEMWDYFSGTIQLLEIQTARHLELGTSHRYANGITLQGNVFHIDMDDEIAFDADTFSNVNLEKTRHDGLNLQMRGSSSPDLGWQAGYAYRHAVFREGANQGKRIPLIPEHKLSVGGRYQLDPGQRLGIDAIYTGSRFFGDDNANLGKQLPAYPRLDASYARQWARWQLQLRVQNLTNVAAADSGFYNSFAVNPYYYYPLPGRAFYLTLGAEW